MGGGGESSYKCSDTLLLSGWHALGNLASLGDISELGIQPGFMCQTVEPSDGQGPDASGRQGEVAPVHLSQGSADPPVPVGGWRRLLITPQLAT